MKLDLGCGPNKKAGFYGVDSREFPGVDLVLNLAEPGPFFGRDIPTGFKPWPWADNSVDEVHSSHFIEHLTGPERIHFFNELYRVMKPGAKALIITPHWSSGRAYGDLTHQWPPVVEFFWYYVDKPWRTANAPHVDLTCDFHAVWGYTLHPEWQVRNQETQMFAATHYREAAQDMIATLTKK